MKVIVLFLICIVCSIGVKAQQANVYETLLADDSGRILVFVPVKASDYAGSVAVQNDDLKGYVFQKSRFSRAAYEHFLNSHVRDKNPVTVDSGIVELKRFGFLPVQGTTEIDKWAKKGKKSFLRHFFETDLLRRERVRDFNELYAIASRLFEWGILSEIEDASARLRIRRPMQR